MTDLPERISRTRGVLSSRRTGINCVFLKLKNEIYLKQVSGRYFVLNKCISYCAVISISGYRLWIYGNEIVSQIKVYSIYLLDQFLRVSRHYKYSFLAIEMQTFLICKLRGFLLNSVSKLHDCYVKPQDAPC